MQDEYNKMDKISRDLTEELLQMSTHITYRKFAYLTMEDLQNYFKN